MCKSIKGFNPTSAGGGDKTSPPNKNFLITFEAIVIWPWNFRTIPNFYFGSFLNKNFFCQAVNHAYVSKLKFDPIFSVQNAVFHCKFQIEITFDTVMLWTWNFDSSLVWTRQSISKKKFFWWRHIFIMARQFRKN